MMFSGELPGELGCRDPGDWPGELSTWPAALVTREDCRGDSDWRLVGRRWGGTSSSSSPSLLPSSGCC